MFDTWVGPVPDVDPPDVHGGLEVDGEPGLVVGAVHQPPVGLARARAEDELALLKQMSSFFVAFAT